MTAVHSVGGEGGGEESGARMGQPGDLAGSLLLGLWPQSASQTTHCDT